MKASPDIRGIIFQSSGVLLVIRAGQRVRDASAITVVGPFRPQHAQSVAAAVKGLGQAAFDAAFGRGRGMTIDEGVAFAVEGEQQPKPAPAAKPGRPTELTRRQLEIARLVADDLTNKADRGQAVPIRAHRGNPHHPHPQQARPKLPNPAQPLDG
jgi:hypothetical protein